MMKKLKKSENIYKIFEKKWKKWFIKPVYSKQLERNGFFATFWIFFEKNWKIIWKNIKSWTERKPIEKGNYKKNKK